MANGLTTSPLNFSFQKKTTCEASSDTVEPEIERKDGKENNEERG